MKWKYFWLAVAVNTLENLGLVYLINKKITLEFFISSFIFAVLLIFAYNLIDKLKKRG